MSTTGVSSNNGVSTTGVLRNSTGVDSHSLGLLTPSQLPPGKYYRFTYENETHRGVTYVTGLNVDPLPFNPSGQCRPGGLYFLHESQVGYWADYCIDTVWMREVTFPDESVSIWAEEDKYKADRFILGERESIPKWVWLEVVKNRGTALEDIPVSLRSADVCLKAVKQDGDALRFVPVCLTAPELMAEIRSEAVRQTGQALQFIPKDRRTKAVCLEAVRQDGLALLYVPDDLKTEEICNVAVNMIARALLYVPDDLKSHNMCLKAVRQDGLVVIYVPEGKRLKEIYLEAVRQCGLALYYIPEDKRSQAICLEAVRQHGMALQHVPEDKKSQTICLEAVKQCRSAVYCVPENLRKLCSSKLDPREEFLVPRSSDYFASMRPFLFPSTYY